MTTGRRGPGLGAGVRRAARRTRVVAGVAVAGAVAAVVPGVLLVAWVAGDWSLAAGPLALVAAGGALALGLGLALTRRWVLPVDDTAVAAAAEREEGLADGALRGVLELGRDLPDGVSRALFERTEEELAGRLAGASLTGDVGRRARRRRGRALLAVAGLTAVVTAAGLAVPDRARAAWAPLLRPMAHLEGPSYPPLMVTPGDTTVDRGADVAVTVRAPLRDRVTVHWRAMGDVPAARTLAVDSGAARSVLGPVAAVTRYWVAAPDGAVSDTFRIEPRDPLLLAGLAVDVVYPPHTGLEADHYAGDVPALRVPAGTGLRVRGRLTRPAGAVALVRERGGAEEGDRRTAEVRGAVFSLDWRVGPDDAGEWTWRLEEPGGGAPVEGVAPPLELTVMPDAPPAVRVVVPGVDTLMPSSRRQPVVADAVDDYGVAEGALVFRRAGSGDSTVASFPLQATAPRVLLRGLLDASSLGLVPGDAVEYYVAVTDNRPGAAEGAGNGAGRSRSATYTLRLPGMAGLRDRAREDADGVLDAARRLADRSRSLESATRDLARRARTTGREGAAPTPASREPLGFDDAARSRDVLDGHEAMLEQIASLQDRMAELERAVREAGLEDPELRRRLEEIRSLYAELESEELRASMEELRRGLEGLDPEAVRDALERLAEHQEALRRQVEESLEMLRRAAAEQEMNAAARDAEELAARQDALNAAAADDAAADEAEAAAPDSARARRERLAGTQERLADRTGELSARLDSLRRELRALRDPDPADAAGQAGTEVRRAAAAMDTAAGASREGRGERSARSGESAASSLRSAAARLDGARARMAEARARAAMDAVGRATVETLGLAERQEALRRELDAVRRRGGMTSEAARAARSEQAAVEEGLEQVRRTVAEAALRSAMVDASVGEALDEARERLAEAAAGLDDGNVPVDGAGEAVESLNRLALSLLANEGRIQQAGEGGDGAQEAMRRLSELARAQGGLNGQVGALVPLGLSPEALARQLAELARRQQGIAEGVEETGESLTGRDDVLGDMDALAEEAEAIARELESGRLDPEVRARQERLFNRLLDAGRSLERDEYSDRRVAERASGVTGASPAELDAELLDAGLRYPVPTADQLRGLPPAYRALVLEYFDRLNRAAGGGG